MLVALLLNALVAIVIVGAIMAHLVNNLSELRTQALQKAENAARTQVASINDQLQNMHHVMGQLTTRLNQVMLLEQGQPERLHDVLRQFQYLVPGTLDLMLIDNEGYAITASNILAGRSPLLSYCPELSQYAARIKAADLWAVGSSAEGGRCPPEGTLIHTYQPTNAPYLPFSSIWLLLSKDRFERTLALNVQDNFQIARYRLLANTTLPVAQGQTGPDHATLPGFPPAFEGDKLHDKSSTLRWTDPESGEPMAGVSIPITGAAMHVQVAYPEDPATLPVFKPYLGRWVAGTFVFLLFWTAVAAYSVRMIKRYQAALTANQRALIEAANHTQAILDNVVDAVITIDKFGRILTFNPAAERIFHFSPQEIIGQRVASLMPKAYRNQRETYAIHRRQNLADGIVNLGQEVTGRRKNGETFPMHVAISRIERNGSVEYVALIRDISEQRKAEAIIEHLAYFDQLTGLPNRRLLIDKLNKTLRNSDHSQQFNALFMIDLNDFKTYNETFGHEAGDQLLKAFAGRLRQCLPEGTTLARFGGDEFMMFTEDLGTESTQATVTAELLAQKILGVMSQPFSLDGREQFMSTGIGITLCGSNPAETANMLIGQADIAMYHAKRTARNSYQFFDPTLQAALADKVDLEADMRQGLGQKQFRLNFQPQVDINNTVVGVEALLRWQHPVRGNVSPAHFIPLAEQSGFILDLGYWVLEQACLKLAEWSSRPDRQALTIAVNVSAQQFRHASFVSQVQLLLTQTGAEPSRLKLELTESMLAEDIESLIDKMSTLRAMGVQFSLDDFGTGYSSLSYLKRLPLDQLKIDQSFVRDIMDDPNDASIVKAILTLGQSLGLTVVAEGVETAEQRDFLSQHRCQKFQGYFFSRPLESDTLETFLGEHRAAAVSGG